MTEFIIALFLLTSQQQTIIIPMSSMEECNHYALEAKALARQNPAQIISGKCMHSQITGINKAIWIPRPYGKWI